MGLCLQVSGRSGQFENDSKILKLRCIDGLMETRDVDEPLRIKLNRHIFIPLVAQTSCDPKSFAWKYRFLAFKKNASTEQFGQNVRHLRGNVTSRVLTCIRQQYPCDKQILKGELRGALRSIEFAYRTAGVVRPLKAVEQDAKRNLTYHSDQTNKVARPLMN